MSIKSNISQIEVEPSHCASGIITSSFRLVNSFNKQPLFLFLLRSIFAAHTKCERSGPSFWVKPSGRFPVSRIYWLREIGGRRYLGS